MTKYDELKTTIAGVEFKNPFIVGVGPPTKNAEKIIKIAKGGWAGATTKTIIIEPTKDPSPRMAARAVDGHLFAMENIELLTTFPMSDWEKWIKRIKAEAPSDFVLIASIMGTPDLETWDEPLKVSQEAGADMIELNVSCPHGSPEHYMGAYIGQDPDLTARVTKHVKRDAKVPVIVKFTPNVTDIKPIAKAANEAGADAFTLANTHGPVIMGVDIERAEPIPSVRGFSSPGGMSGPAVKPIVLKLIAETLQVVPDAQVFGLGGVVSWYDAMEYMMIGARAVESVTGVIWYGTGIIENLIDGTLEFLKSHNYSSVQDVIGKAFSRLKAHSDLSFEKWASAWVDPEKCIACSRCIVACRDSGEGALYVDTENMVVRIDIEKCGGCGICQYVCPTGAIRMVAKEEAEKMEKEFEVSPISVRMQRYYSKLYEGIRPCYPPIL